MRRATVASELRAGEGAALLSDTTRRLLTLPTDAPTFLGDAAIRGRAAATALRGFGAT